MKRLQCTLAVLFSLVFSVQSRAQFVTSGSAPSNTKWDMVRTRDFKVIYPREIDSLAREYAVSLERFKNQLSGSIGFVPNQSYRRPMPVVVHPFISEANGMVTWTPRRMELYNCPDPYKPLPMDWIQQLAIHEGRHVAQMQYVRARPFRFLHILSGELFSGGAAALYGGQAFFEGDAVVAETALTRTGRGRSADFLEYYHWAFDNGDDRSWYQWRYGSLNRPNPNHYALGYITLAGLRVYYDDPLFCKEYYDKVLARDGLLLPFRVMPKRVKAVTGERFRRAMDSLVDSLRTEWVADMDARGPVTVQERMTPEGRHFTTYTGTVAAGGSLYSVRYGLDSGYELVKTDPVTGAVKTLGGFSSNTSKLVSSERLQRIYWSETLPDVRYEMKSSGAIRYMDLSREGRYRTLSTGSRYFNPSVSPDGLSLCVTSYPVTGGSQAVVLDALTGAVLRSMRAPAGFQLVESAWLEDGSLVFSCTGPDGIGLYDERFGQLIAPRPVYLHTLRSCPEGVMFVCDATGADEVYTFNPADGALLRVTNSRYGSSECALSPDGALLCSSLDGSGKGIYSVEREAVDASAEPLFSYHLADELSRQEQEIADSFGSTGFPEELSEPRRYSKLTHALRIHSWVPLAVEYDEIEQLSLDKAFKSTGIGATVFMQNELGNVSGEMMYDVIARRGHVQLNCSSLFPVIEARLDFTPSGMVQYQRLGLSGFEGTSSQYIMYSQLDDMLFSGSLRAYVPFNFSSGGWSRGVVPSVKLSVGGDRFDTSLLELSEMPGFYGPQLDFSGIQDGNNVIMSRLGLNLRAYSSRPEAHSTVFPVLGAGMEAGLNLRPWMSNVFTPVAFAYAYGYLPGLLPRCGVKLTAKYQQQLGNAPFGDNCISVSPRGFEAVAGLGESVGLAYPSQAMVTFDYAFPFASLDWDFLSPLTYIRNLEADFFADVAAYGGKVRNLQTAGTLASLGAGLSVHLGNIVWLPFDASVGVSVSYNTGSLMDSLIIGMKRVHVGLTSRIDL